jgi:predicted nucleic acid-binding protein
VTEASVFFDTSVLLYLLSSDAAKADRVEDALVAGGVISVQVLNEFSTVARRKLGMTALETLEVLGPIRSVCRTEPLTEEVFDLGMQVTGSYRYSIYDSMIIASALLAECTVLYSEDLQHGQLVNKRLSIKNPFKI